jgi:hypothetical protein
MLGHLNMWLWVSMEKLHDGHLGGAVLSIRTSVSPIGNHSYTNLSRCVQRVKLSFFLDVGKRPNELI